MSAHAAARMLVCTFVPSQIDSLLREVNTVPAGEEPGPATELEYWRKQMARINSLTEQLKRRECKLVLGVCSVSHSPVSAVLVRLRGSYCPGSHSLAVVIAAGDDTLTCKSSAICAVAA
jgi:hypothetical protein